MRLKVPKTKYNSFEVKSRLQDEDYRGICPIYCRHKFSMSVAYHQPDTTPYKNEK